MADPHCYQGIFFANAKFIPVAFSIFSYSRRVSGLLRSLPYLIFITCISVRAEIICNGTDGTFITEKGRNVS